MSEESPFLLDLTFALIYYLPPVSYTHLAVLRFMQMGLIRYGYDQSYPAFQAVGLLDGGVWPLIGQPVSYTHLDVYKRQGLFQPLLQRKTGHRLVLGAPTL